MTGLNDKSIAEIASDTRVIAAVRRLDRLREAQNIVAELATKLMLAEHTVERIKRETEFSE